MEFPRLAARSQWGGGVNLAPGPREFSIMNIGKVPLCEGTRNFLTATSGELYNFDGIGGDESHCYWNSIELRQSPESLGSRKVYERYLIFKKLCAYVGKDFHDREPGP